MNLTLDETWKYCLEMWKWISEEKEKKERLFVDEAKSAWLKEHNFLSYLLQSDCFFCDWAHNHGDCITNCPGKLVDENFSCKNLEYRYSEKPTKFYQKLVELNNIRVKK